MRPKPKINKKSKEILKAKGKNHKPIYSEARWRKDNAEREARKKMREYEDLERREKQERDELEYIAEHNMYAKKDRKIDPNSIEFQAMYEN